MRSKTRLNFIHQPPFSLSMYLNTTPPCPPRKPCIRDLARLVQDHLPPALVQLAPLKQLKRRIAGN